MEKIPTETLINPVTNEQHRVDQFCELLPGLAIETKDFELDFNGAYDEPVEVAAKQFLTFERTAGSTLYLPTDIAPDKAEVKAFLPRMSRGGKHSGHGVFFGDVIFTNDQKLPVAAKPHWDNPAASCMKDYLNNVAVTQLGLESLKPAGFIVGHDGSTAYSLTKLEVGLTTLDSINWKNFYPDFTKDQGMLNIWEQVAVNLAYIHSLGSLHHGDLAPRNIAQTPEGNLFFIDWERSRISLSTPRDAEVRYSYSHPDLAALLESLCRPTHDNFKAGIGLFYGKEGDWWQGFSDLIFDHYKADRLAYAEQGNHHAANLREVKEELYVLEKELKSDTHMFRDICQNL